jgi:hypothetical protein
VTAPAGTLRPLRLERVSRRKWRLWLQSGALQWHTAPEAFAPGVSDAQKVRQLLAGVLRTPRPHGRPTSAAERQQQ